jgi:predicted small metal-binding protein
MATKQYKQLGCLDLDPNCGCAWQLRAETEDEIMRLGAEHARLIHQKDMASMPSDLKAKIKASIKTVAVNV